MDSAEKERLAVVAGMAPTLFVSLQTDLRQVAEDAWPPSVQRYSARIHVEWSPDTGPDVDVAELSQLGSVDAEGFLPELGGPIPRTLVIGVGRGDFVWADLEVPGCWEGLSALGLDLGLVGEGLLGESFDAAELHAAYDLDGERAVIVNNVEIATQWRGGGYGLLATELVLAELGRAADIAALYPMRPGLSDFAERLQASRALSTYWGRLGFEDFNGIMVRPLWVAAEQ